MNIDNFKSGVFKSRYQFKSFSPEKINHFFEWNDVNITTLLSKADRALGSLNAYSKLIPNIDLFVKMHTLKEANTSSRIEGTNTQIDEVLMGEESIDPQKKDDWVEVQNYVNAMNQAIADLKKLPLSSRLIKNTHKILMQGVRGEKKRPGEFRTSQNWVGGSSINNALFIPPDCSEIDALIGDLDKFINNDSLGIPHLVKLAIIHYQFETIHPFLDGNGRVGRLLITLYLVNKNLLTKPSLYLSEFFEKNKGAYYDALTLVRESNNLKHWIQFFLTAVLETAENSIETFDKILQIEKEMDSLIFDFGKKAKNAKKLINYFYSHPILTVKEIAEKLDVTTTSARNLVSDFVDREVLFEITGFRRNQAYVFKQYLKVF